MNDSPLPDAPLVQKVQHICSRLDIDENLPIMQVVLQATAQLNLDAALANTTLIGKVELCLDALRDRTVNARPPSTPNVAELQAEIQADMIAQAEAAWAAMQVARQRNVAVESVVASASVGSGGSEEARQWLRAHGVPFPEGALLEELETIVAEERAAIAEEEAAMADYNTAMESRGQPAVVTAISTAGREMTVLDEARAGEEAARRELIQAAEAAAAAAAATRAAPVVAGTLVSDADGAQYASAQVPVVVASAVVVDEDPNRPRGGVAALANSMRIS